MIEQALVTLVQADSDVSTMAPVAGFFDQLPKGQSLPSWTYCNVADKIEYTLTGSSGLGYRRIQIDCYGNNAADAILLAAAIDEVLSGFSGTVLSTGSPSTTLAVIQGCFRISLHDFFDADSRTYRRMLEYELWFSQN